MINISIIRSGTTVIVSDGKQTRQSLCATPASAKGLETKLKNDKPMALRWLKATEQVQLELPLDPPANQLDIEDAINAVPPRA